MRKKLWLAALGMLAIGMLAWSASANEADYGPGPWTCVDDVRWAPTPIPEATHVVCNAGVPVEPTATPTPEPEPTPTPTPPPLPTPTPTPTPGIDFLNPDCEVERRTAWDWLAYLNCIYPDRDRSGDDRLWSGTRSGEGETEVVTQVRVIGTPEPEAPGTCEVAHAHGGLSRHWHQDADGSGDCEAVAYDNEAHAHWHDS